MVSRPKSLSLIQMASRIQYPFAFDENDNLVHIDSVQREHRHERTYHCPGCGDRMIPRIGKSNAHHFAHAENNSCDVESAIHIFAKRILATRFNDRSRPFNVKFWTRHICRSKEGCRYYDQNYCEDYQMDEFELHKTYDKPAREEVRLKTVSDEVFQPDVILESSSPKHAPIFLEVYHKHKSSPKKLESGQHIIEIRVKDWSELIDLETIEIVQSERIRFYGFKDRFLLPERFKLRGEKIAKEFGMNDPDSFIPGCFRSREGQRGYQDWWRVVLFPSGKTYYSGIYEDEIQKHRPSAVADVTFNRKKVPESFSFMPLLVERIPRGLRNCFMCCHCSQNDSDVRWCELVKNGSTRKRTFDKDKGSKCSFFEWFRSPLEQPKVDLVENVDYTIWINPNLAESCPAPLPPSPTPPLPL